jgi:hypothetical protein
MAGMTELRKERPVVRKVGGMVVKLTTDGIAIRGRRRRKSYFVPFSELAKLATRLDPPTKPGWTEKQWADPLKTMGVNS